MRNSLLDSDKTAPFVLGPEDGPPALLVHGFTGSPWDTRPLGEALAARGHRVHGMRLPGHGTTAEALLHVTHEDWTVAVEDALLALHEKEGPVCVAGLSVGALLAAQVVARHPAKVVSLALLAPALRLSGLAVTLVRALGLAGVLPRALPWVRKEGTDLSDPHERAEAPVLPAFPSARLRDVFTLQDEARAALSKVRCATLVVSARKDHVVAAGAGVEVALRLTRAKRVRHVSLREGFHILPRDRDRVRLAQEVGDFFARVAARTSGLAGGSVVDARRSG